MTQSYLAYMLENLRLSIGCTKEGKAISMHQSLEFQGSLPAEAIDRIKSSIRERLEGKEMWEVDLFFDDFYKA